MQDYCIKFIENGIRISLSNSFVTDACLVADNVSTWILDSATTNHICCSLTGFKKTKSLEEGEFSFRWGDVSLVSAKVWEQ